MKRFAIVLVAGLMPFAGLTIAQAREGSSSLRVSICHRTKSTKNPYVRIVVRDKATLAGHMRHAADIIPAPAGGCPHTILTPTTGGVALHATLTGSAEVPPADPDGSGTATIRLRSGQGQVCFLLEVKLITLPAAAAHIHKGTAGQNGDVVVPLTAPGADGMSSGCVAASRSLVSAILANPAGYYVNVHTTDFPNGAIRGQLG